jgi:hypothetical protein
LATAATAAKTVNVFICYAREDSPVRANLEKYLVPLSRMRRISVWSDGHLIPGQTWDAQIRRQLAEADVVILLLSIDFLNSQYILETELRIAVERHRQAKARLIPVLVRPLPQGANPFPEIQGLPADLLPIESWEDKEQAYVDVADGIGKAVEEIAAATAPRATEAAGLPFARGWQPKSHIFCDRDEQEFEFLSTCRALLKARPGIPQVYLIRGEPLDRPDTLVERLYYDKIRNLVNSRITEKRKALYPRILRTRERRDLRWEGVAMMLADDLFHDAELGNCYVAGFQPEEVNGSALVTSPKMEPYSFIVVRHDIDAGRLGADTERFLNWYINSFFSGLQGGADLPQLLVFLNLIIREPGSSGFRWRFLKRGGQRGAAVAVDEAIRRVCPPSSDDFRNGSANFAPGSGGCPCKALKELSPIDQDHIQRWLLESDPRPTEADAERQAAWIFGQLRSRSNGPVRMDALATWEGEQENQGDYQSL